MNNKKPLISVGMPVYNGELYLELAIQCILDQTNGNFELVISDNASTDNTEKICRKFAKNDERIVYIRNKSNIGAAKNYNNVFRLTKAPFFRWHNADDLCDPNLHELCLSVLIDEPAFVLCYGKTQLIDQRGKVISKYEDDLNLQQEIASTRFKTFFKQVGLTNIIYGLMRRSAVEKTLLMGNGNFYAADINFMAEMTLYGKFYEIPKTLFYRRMHENSSSWDRKNSNTQQEFWKGKNDCFILPFWKKEISLLKAINHAPINKWEKIELCSFILRRMIQERPILIQDILHLMNSKLNMGLTMR